MLADNRKIYRFQKRTYWNEEVFLIKLKHHLDCDLSKAKRAAVLRKLEQPLENIEKLADEIYNSDLMLEVAKENLEYAKDCKDFEDFDYTSNLWCDIVEEPLDNMDELFSNTLEFLRPYGLEGDGDES